jgi:hypothetical protein
MATAAALIVATILASTAPAAASTPTAAEYARTVTGICRGALLFEGSHEIGTRAGAIAVSRDIRATGSRRLRKVAAVPKPPATAAGAERWLALERRLVATYASTYVRIWDEIDRATSPAEHSRLVPILQRLIHRPDRLQGRAVAIEQALGVPDCTGGLPQTPPSNAPPSGPAIG